MYLVCGSLVGLNRFEDQNSLTQNCSPRGARPFLDGEERESKPAAGSDGHPCHSQSNGSGQVGTHLAFHQQRIRGPLVPKICGEDMHDSLTFVPNNFLLYFRWGGNGLIRQHAD